MNKSTNHTDTSLIGGRTLVIAAAGILAGLSTFSLVGPLMTPFGALFGLVWGWGLTQFAKRLANTPERQAKVATTVLILLAVSTSIQLGGGIIYHLFLSAMTNMPGGASFILRPEVGNQLNLFFMISNTVSEHLLLPLAILLNWRLPGRRALVLSVALIFYADRLLTYTYFAPNIISLTAHQTADAAERLRQWASYDSVRLIADIFIPILTLCALARPVRKK